MYASIAGGLEAEINDASFRLAPLDPMLAGVDAWCDAWIRSTACQGARKGTSRGAHESPEHLDARWEDS